MNDVTFWLLKIQTTNLPFIKIGTQCQESCQVNDWWISTHFAKNFFSIVKLPLNYSVILFVLDSTSLKYSKNDTQAVNMHLKLVPCHCSATWTSSNKAMTQLKSNIKVQTDFSNEQSLFISKRANRKKNWFFLSTETTYLQFHWQRRDKVLQFLRANPTLILSWVQITTKLKGAIEFSKSLCQVGTHI